MPSLVKSNSPLAALFKESAAITTLKKGGVVTVAYIGKSGKTHFFDLGRAGTGIIYGLELINAHDIIKDLQPGENILAKVIEPENDEGYAELSVSETTKHQAWTEIKELQDHGLPFKVVIANANTGGLIAVIQDIKAFLPVSQLAANHYPRVSDGDRVKILEELKKFIGQELTVKVIDFNPHTAKLIISERGVLDENMKEQLAKYTVGDIVNVIVSGIADFGVFVKFADNPNIEGLIHISELDHRLIENPREAVTMNDLFKAQITEIKDDRISLSLKALTVNPWDTVKERYVENQEVAATVHRFNQLGAVIKLDTDFHGLIRAAEFGGIPEMQKRLAIGQTETFIIENIKPAEKRIMLKLKV